MHFTGAAHLEKLQRNAKYVGLKKKQIDIKHMFMMFLFYKIFFFLILFYSLDILFFI